MAPRNNNYITIEEAAVLAVETKRTIKSWADKGILKSHRLGSLLYIEKSSLENLIKQRPCTAPKSGMTRRVVFTVLGKVLLGGGWVFPR